ncbi:hypothetical protein AWH69_06050 [Janibacter melonis]|uniref:Tetracyclin repressor-like C-terminal group 31 domain-containing protein n=1 Tax=Janibacter melonis TaxID=262209 RepID=A0A176QD44_9MICO|nr:TetR/AcrR family transcriptional regulator [Janibacter melonis]MBD5830110.1 TetR family transcriptional regulator [Janibacter melonis]OAB87621.1 hypothetical protein AWH69_06050 [Janibacter melonis]
MTTTHITAAGGSALSPRMRQIVDAGIEVVARGGLRGLTHRAVDAEAGLPPGSTSSYLRTRLALTVAVSERVMSIFDESVSGLAHRLDARPLTDEQVVGEVIELFASWLRRPALLLTRQELAAEANRHPEVARVVCPARDATEELIAAMLERLGAPEPEVRARAVLAAGEGVLSAAMSYPEDIRGDYARTVMRTIVEAFATTERSLRAV